MRVWTASLSLVAILAACSPVVEPTATTAVTPEVEPAPTTTVPLVAGCSGDVEFFEGVGIGNMDHPGSDSDVIGTITWEQADACETFTIEFETSEGAPPTTPPSYSARYIDDLPVIRIDLDVDSTTVTDGLVETSLVNRLYVVRKLEGGMFIDLHLAAPAQARITTDLSPARLVVQLQPGIVDYRQSPALGSHIVLLSPLDGEPVDESAAFSGYTRSFESNVIVIATAGGQVVYEGYTTAADSIETWGEYSLETELPNEELSVFVGEESPADGSLDGVTITLGPG